MSLKIKKDDLVQVIAGNDAAKSGSAPRRGRVIAVDTVKQTVVVEGVNLRKHHEKVRQGKDGVSGGLTEREAPIHISNVMVVDPQTDKPVRVGIKVQDGKRVRVTKGKNASGTVLN
jgi:large subunit ribosomal protein L24